MLYRKGNTHVIRGVKCDIGRFENSRLQAFLNIGWVIDPQELVEVEEVVEVAETEEVEESVEVVAAVEPVEAEVVKPTAKAPKKKAGRPRKKK